MPFTNKLLREGKDTVLLSVKLPRISESPYIKAFLFNIKLPPDIIFPANPIPPFTTSAPVSLVKLSKVLDTVMLPPTAVFPVTDVEPPTVNALPFKALFVFCIVN